MRLNGKITIVTGASSGIGKSTAELFAREGATVIAAARRMDRLNALAEAGNGKIHVFACDVCKPEDIKALYKFAMDKFGRIDVVVNNAGAMDGLNDIANTDLELWNRMIATNLTSVYLSCKEALEIFTKQETGGNIINMASVASVRGFGGGFAYTAAKHGVLGITRNIAATYKASREKQWNIRCNCILPCNIDTEVVQACYSILNMEMAKKIGSVGGTSPAGTPEDIANACLFLASDESSYINGIALPVDAGSTAV